MKKIKRVPVTVDYVFELLGKVLGDRIIDKNLKKCLNVSSLTDEEIKKEENELKKKISMNSKRKFIVLFKKGFENYHGFSYNQKIKEKDIGLINALINKLDKQSIRIESLTDWFFVVFLVNNPNFNPGNIGLLCSGWVLDNYFYYIKDEIVKTKVDNSKQAEREQLLDMARKLRTENPKDKDLKEGIKNFEIRRFDNNSFRRFLVKKSREFKRKNLGTQS